MKQLLFGSSMQGNKVFNISWALFRIYIGLSIAIGAGFPKMSNISAPGWFVDQVRTLGFTFPSPAFWAAMASWGEFVGGLCIALGFFTRFSALQLAFQFFVVAFIWYDNPMPMLGMYYQQLLFWGFVLITFAGSGRYAIDEWIMNRKPTPAVTKNFAAAMLLMIAFLSSSSFIQQPNEPIITASELKLLNGKWKGTLTYRDYTSGKSETIHVIVNGSRKGNKQSDRSWSLQFAYPQEPGHETTDELTVSADGRMINEATLTEKTKLPDGTLRVVLESSGKDGNDHKPCTIKKVIVLSEKNLTITKLVRFDGETDFLERNQYNLSR